MMIIVVLAACTMLVVPAMMGITGYGESINDTVLAWLTRSSKGKPPSDIKTLLQYPVIDHLNSDRCSFDSLASWAKERGIEAAKIEVAEIDCKECPNGKRRGVKAKIRIEKGEGQLFFHARMLVITANTDALVCTCSHRASALACYHHLGAQHE